VDVLRDRAGRIMTWTKRKLAPRIYWRVSLFLYQVIEDEPTPLIVFWRATCYTVGAPADKETLWQILEAYAEDTLVEPRDTVSWEEEQVEPREGRSVRWNWVDIAKAEARGRELIHPEEHVAWVDLRAWEASHS